MTIQDYLRIFREQRIAMVIVMLLGIGGAAAVFFLRPVEYTARLTLYVSTQGADTTQAAFQGAQLSQDRVASYTELLTGPRVATDVIGRLGLPETSDELSKKITASSKLNSVLLDVTVADNDPQRAANIANTIGDAFPGLVAELERSTTPGGQPAVVVRVVQPALVPLKPSSTGLPVTLALGFIAGLAAALGIALARNALDVSIKSPDQLRDAVEAPNLSSIAFDADIPRRPLTVHEGPQSPRSEAFRQLRTNLQFVDVDNKCKVIVITSAMPSEGKSTTVANLAIALASAGSRVLLIEADLRRPTLSAQLGLERSIGLTSILSGRVKSFDAIQTWGMGSFAVLASGPLPPNPSELLGSRHMRALIQELKPQYDVILIDSPPVLPVADAAAIAPATDGAIIVCRFKKTTRTQVRSAAEALASVSSPLLGTVLTMVPRKGPHAYAQYNSYYRRQTGNAPAEAVPDFRRLHNLSNERTATQTGRPSRRPA